MNFTEDLVSIIRQQRHLGTRVLIATQEPTLSPALIDLCNVTIVHRFLSPAWFETLKKHLAGAVVTGSNKPSSVTDIFHTIVALRTGEALVFSPAALLDVGVQDLTSPSSKLPLVRLEDSFIKLRIRKRLTADGGKSIMASDVMPAPEWQFDSRYKGRNLESSGASGTGTAVTPLPASRFSHPGARRTQHQPQPQLSYQQPAPQSRPQLKQPPMHQPHQAALPHLSKEKTSPAQAMPSVRPKLTRKQKKALDKTAAGPSQEYGGGGGGAPADGEQRQ